MASMYAMLRQMVESSENDGSTNAGLGPLPDGATEDARDDRPPAGLAGTAVLGSAYDAVTRLVMALDSPPPLLSMN